MRKNTCIYRRTAMLLGEATFMLSASALPAAAQTMRLDRQAGTCEELNTRVASLGVTDEEGMNHPNTWGWTTFQILANGFPPTELDWSTVPMKMHTSPSGCVQASGVEIYFQAQTQMTRIDWKPDRPTCAAKAWTERRSLIESHEAKHVKSVNDAVKSGNAAWVKSGAFEACGRNAKQKVANQIVALFKKTFRALTDQIAKSADALDLRERVEPLDCKATAGCHAQSTVQYTGRWAAGGFEDEDACVQLANPGTDTFTGELQGDEHLLTGDFKRTVAMPYCNWKGGTEHFKWCVLMITGSQTVSLELRPKDMEIQGRGIIRVINISPHAVDSLRFTISGDCFGTADTENDGDTREEIERILKQDLSHTYYMPTHDIPMPPNSELRLRPGRYESKEGTNATATLDLTGFTNSSP